jgi:hypothetical protein
VTYETVIPYLKGLHLTLAAHHPQRNLQGWKLSPKEWDAYVWSKESEGIFSVDEAATFSEEGIDPIPPKAKCKQAVKPPAKEGPAVPPKQVVPVKRLKFDIDALCALFNEDTPTEVLLRAPKVYSILYGFADASGTGFGSTILGEDGITYRIGTWESYVDEESSNFREFENVVCALEEEALNGNLCDALVFLFTDNSTVESGLNKGNSSSEKLFELCSLHAITPSQVPLQYCCHPCIRKAHDGSRNRRSVPWSLEGRGVDWRGHDELHPSPLNGPSTISHSPRMDSILAWPTS